MLKNLFSAGPLIVERLESALESFDIKTIATFADVFMVLDFATLCPSVIVIPGAGTLNEEAGAGKTLVEQQDWHVMIGLTPVRDRHSDSPDDIAGEIATAIIKSLSGWTPSRDFWQSMKYEGREAPQFASGYAEYLLNFSLIAGIT
jgi:hypothetical protein